MKVKNKIRITVLVENSVYIPRVRAEHGWSVYIETKQGNIIFDTGQSEQFIKNAELLNINLKTIDSILLSHGHYDHTGGLSHLLMINHSAKIYAHPDVFKDRYSIEEGMPPREIGMPFKKLPLERFSLSREPQILLPGIISTGEISSRINIKDRFFDDPEGKFADLIMDDQALFFETNKGIVVVLGCCHAGLEMTLNKVKELSGNKKIYMVIGGMHLNSASEEIKMQTVNVLKKFSVKKIGLSHCTGFYGIKILLKHFPDECFLCNTGYNIEI